MANGGPGVVIVESGGLPVTQVTGGGNAAPFTVVTGNGFPVTLVSTLGTAVALYNLDGTEYSSLTAPVLTWTSGVTDNTPNFSAPQPADPPAGLRIELQLATDVGFTPPPTDTELADVTVDPVLVAISPSVADGTYWARARWIDAADAALSDWSNVETKTVDTTAPTLSSPTDASTGQTTATATVSTNEANGTLYCVVTTSSTSPTAAQVKAGQDNSGAAATYASSQAISSTGVKSFSATGLTAGTAYTAHFMHEDAVGNQSTVSKGDGLTTDSAATTWNPSDKSASITLSGGNLVATNPGSTGWRGVRSIASHSTGKYYCETTATVAVTNELFGIGNASGSFTSYLGDTGNNDMGWAAGGPIYRNTGNTGSIQTFTTGSVRCMAVDMDNLKIWFRTDGGNWNNDVIGNQNPATNTGGRSFSALNAGPWFVQCNQFDANAVVTANFGGSAYAQTPPSGFGNW